MVPIIAATLVELITNPVEANKSHVVTDLSPMEQLVKLSVGDQFTCYSDQDFI